MNRIQHWASAEIDAQATAAASKATVDGEVQDAHCVFTPLHYERNYAYPLIVWLHGAGDDERQVSRIMPHVSLRNFVAVGPRGTVECDRSDDGFHWSQDAAQIDLAEDRVASAISAARRWLNIARERVFLAGYGCGGTMAFRLALRQPRRYAGVVSIGGAFPSTLRPLARLHEVRSLNVLLSTSRTSRAYPPREVCQNLRLFHAAGMSACLRQYPGGDELTDNMLADVNRWIMEQLTAPQSAPSDQASPKR